MLREHTQTLHHQLDHHPVMARLLMPELAADDYANTLSWLHPLQIELELALTTRQNLLPQPTSWVSRLKPLEDDLEQLNKQPVVLRERAIEPPVFGDSAGTAAGMLYVLDGARLGSAHIARRIQHTLAHLPCRYFMEANGATHWPTTLKVLEQLDRSEYSQCIAAAETVFGWYLTVMDRAAEPFKQPSS